MTDTGCSLFEELCALVAIGAATAEEQHIFQNHLDGGCTDCAAALSGLLETTANLVMALPSMTPPSAVRTRLLDAVSGVNRFESFFQEIARLCDLSVNAVRNLLARIDNATAWERGPFPFVRLIHFQAGPSLSTADTGLVRTSAGATFPRHRHIGEEITFVLEGSLWDNGRQYLPGEIIQYDTDSVHEYRADPERDLITIVAYHGIDII
jgi:hypothetical protein